MKRPVFLDHHATTPCDPRVVTEMLPYFSENFGNPSSSNALGEKARSAVEEARASVAQLIGADAKEIVFTSGATEANNLALWGVARAYEERAKEIVACVTEHRAVLDPLHSMDREGWKVTLLPVDSKGRVDLDQLRTAVTEQTTIVSLMAANNEIGTIHPVAEIAKVVSDKGVLFHCDAAQAVGKIPLDVKKTGIDLLSFSAHKIYGPKGVGALFVRGSGKRIRLTPLIEGGGQERGLRSGTLNVPAIVGFGAAARIAMNERMEEVFRVEKLRNRLQSALEKRVPKIQFNGDVEHRLPNNLSVSFQGITTEGFLRYFPDIAVSSGSACQSMSREPSHVLKAIGMPDPLGLATIRFGLGRFTTEEEIDFAASHVEENVAKLRALSPIWKDS